MDSSIEEIWSNAFQDNKYLIPPVIVDLYNKKSILTVDKLKSTSKKDNWSIIPIAIITLIFFIINSKLTLGIYISALMLSMFFFNKKQLEFLNTIDTSEPCFHYLIKLQKWIKNNVKFYTRLLGIGFPLFAYVGFCIFIMESNQHESILESYSFKELLAISIFILTSFSSIGILCYRLSNYLIYGRLIKKIDEMVNELDTLKK
ncbi:hypothetical protein OAX11_04765 [Flavobacteriaceae bacterium]|nr:hypothetical protein [Flavobacteriaceae bacterium]